MYKRQVFSCSAGTCCSTPLQNLDGIPGEPESKGFRVLAAENLSLIHILKLEEKVHELLESASIDEGRIATEVTIFADKICVDEETVRLRSHIEHTRKELLAGGSVGRKLDFIAQEMNREANTILSKANDLEISEHAIILKTEIEKVREQIQNIE